MNRYRCYQNTWIFIEENKEILLSNEEAAKILSEKGLMVRNTYDFDTEEKTDFWFVIKDSFGGLEELPPSSRRNVKKALKNYNIRKCSAAEFKEKGYEVEFSAMKSYKVRRSCSREEYWQMIEQYEKEGNYDFWCAERISDGRFVATSVNRIKEDSCEYDSTKALVESLHDRTYPNYGLFYEMNRYYLEELGLKYVSDGSRTITNHSNIQDYLTYNFRFRKAYCKLKIHYKWWFAVVIKLLFPFRKLIPIRKIQAVLRMEHYSRNSQ